MIKFSFLLLFIILLNFSIACDTGCLDSTNVCRTYGDSFSIGVVSYYCDYDLGSALKKNVGEACLNDFECASPYKCLSGFCTSAFNSLIQEYNLISENFSGFCPAYEDPVNYFCSNVSVVNSFLLTNKNCTGNYGCYKCKDSTYTFNASLGACITGMCKSTPGCLNVAVNNSTINSDYCPSVQGCYTCDNDFLWDVNLTQCVMKSCVSSPGCLNISNLSDGHIVNNRLCDSGTCFICNSGRIWNATSSTCVLSSTHTGTWTPVGFTSSELSTGTYKLLSSYEKVVFNFAGRGYYFGLFGADSRISFEIGADSGTSAVSLINNQILYPGESRGFDLDNDGTYDLRVSLDSIKLGNANISLKFVSENYLPSRSGSDGSDSGYDPSLPGSVDTRTSSSDNLDLDSSAATESFVQRNLWVLIILGTLLVILLIILFFYLLNKRNMTSSNKSTPANPAPQQQRPPMAPGNAPMGYPIGGYRPLNPRPTSFAQPVKPVQQTSQVR